MNRHNSIFAAVLALAAAAAAADTNSAARLVVTNYPLAQGVVSNNCIVVTATGRVAVAWAMGQQMLARPRLLEDVPRAYAASGRKVGFTITPCANTTNQWHYVNKDREPSDIIEVARYGPDAECGEMLFRVDGERFFGNFRVLLAIRARPHDADSSDYNVQVWAYPENGMVRFFVRNLGLVEHFFHKKTGEIEQIVRDVVLQLNREQMANQPAPAGSTVTVPR